MKKIVAGMMNALLRFTSSLKAEVRSTRTHSLFPSTRLLSRFPYRLRTIWDAYYPVKRIRMGVHGCLPGGKKEPDRKSTRLNSSHANISYAVFCLKKKYHDSCFAPLVLS